MRTKTNAELLDRYGLDALRRAEADVAGLVGLPYNDDPTARPGEGIDCAATVALAYRLIGQALDDEDAWNFPPGLEPPYDPDDVESFAQHWQPIREPAFGAVVDFDRSHIGIIAELTPHGPRVLHNSETIGAATLAPWRVVGRYIAGIYTLRPTPTDGPADATEGRRRRPSAQTTP